MKKFKSVRNGQIAELVSENEQRVIIRLEESEEERNISLATLKRWWKPYEEESVTEEPQTEEITQEEPAEEINIIDITEDEEPAQIDFTEFEEINEEEEEPLEEESAPKKEKKKVTRCLCETLKNRQTKVTRCFTFEILKNRQTKKSK